MKRKFLASIIATVFAVSSVYALGYKDKVKASAPANMVGVSYSGHVQDIGWQMPVHDGAEAGTEGQGLRVEALKLNLENAPAGAHIEYQAHVQDIGWQKWVSDGQEAGTDGQSLRVEALKIKLKDMPGYSIQYRAHVQNIGWQDWVSDGQEAGTDGQSLRVEALEIKIVKISDNSTVGVSYAGHVQNIGWQDDVENGQIAGTEGQGLRVEALKLNLENAPAGASIKYQTHVQNIGWQNPVSDGQEGGTDGKGLRVEAIKISLENLPGYSVQYRAHVENIGWQPWVSDGAEAGTDGKGLRVEAIEVRIVKTGTTTSTVPVSSVSLNKNTDTLNVGDTDTLMASVSPDNATNKNVTWISSNSSIATVDNTGKITAVSAGTANIIATTEDGSKTASCTVTVNNSSSNNNGSLISKTNDTIRLFQTDQLTTSIPESESPGWYTSDSNIVTVDSMGKITGVSAGTAVITVSSSSVSSGCEPKKASCVVTVTESTSPTGATGHSVYQPKEDAMNTDWELSSQLNDAVGKTKNPNGLSYYNNNNTRKTCTAFDGLDGDAIDTAIELMTPNQMKTDIESVYDINDGGFYTSNGNIYKVVGVYKENTSVNSSDINALSTAAQELNTEFLTSGYDSSQTFDRLYVNTDGSGTYWIDRIVVYCIQK